MNRTEDKNKAAQIAEIERVMAMLLSPGAWYELFTLPWKNGNGKAHVKADGYFRDNVKLMVAEAMRLSQRGNNVYFHINPVIDELSSRAINRVVDYADTRANKEQIARRSLLFVEADPVRASNIAATDEQHSAALKRAQEAREWLMVDNCWPAPIVMSSGNGAYQFFRVDLANDAASEALIERALKSLSQRFSDNAVKIDAGVFIANQMARFPGSINRKGDETQERPHRVARFIDPPAEFELVTREQLEQVAAEAPADPHKVNGEASPSAELQQVLKAIEQRGITVKQDGDCKYILSECLFDPTHSGGTSVAIIEYPKSKLKVYCCKHEPECSKNGKNTRVWGDVLEKIGLVEKKANSGFELMKLCDLLKKEFPKDEFLWEGRLVRGTVSIVISKPKVRSPDLDR
jgi:hypothetical protein